MHGIVQSLALADAGITADYFCRCSRNVLRSQTASKLPAATYDAKLVLVAPTDELVFSSAESPEQQARRLDLADTALHNPRPRAPEVNPENRAREEHQQVSRSRNLLKKSNLDPERC
jgi:hypothetical protein